MATIADISSYYPLVRVFQRFRPLFLILLLATSEPLAGAHGTLRFYGSPAENHGSTRVHVRVGCAVVGMW